ncbi:MAG TPA: hypothetical protein VLT87_11155 [Thermoanaerobaculia bacterium]|nr:hypothetical protein [Thermoanaerobaculia bacterium]
MGKRLPTLNPRKWAPQGNCPICRHRFLSSYCHHTRQDVLKRLAELRDVRELLVIADQEGAHRG